MVVADDTMSRSLDERQDEYGKSRWSVDPALGSIILFCHMRKGAHRVSRLLDAPAEVDRASIETRREACHGPHTLWRNRARLVRRTPRRHTETTPPGRTHVRLHASAGTAPRGGSEVRRSQDPHRL